MTATSAHAGRDSMDSTAKIKVADVTMSFGQTVALDGADLVIPQSEIVTVVGPSGCGKTTLLNILAGFETPTSGEVMVDGSPVSGPGPDRSVVFQQPSLMPWLTVRKNLEFGHPRAKRRELGPAIEELLAIMDLTAFEHSYPYQLSGGMMQRVAIARALLRDPDVLLMDEPFGALDAQTRLSMQELLQSIWLRYKPTIFFITHDVDEAIFVGSRVLVMAPRPGRIIDDITVRFERPRDYKIMMDPAFVEIKQRILNQIHVQPPGAKSPVPVGGRSHE